MWFFDTVLEEASKENAVATPTPVTTTAKKDDDGSFLIIKDDMKAESLPDTAVQLFDAAPTELTITAQDSAMPVSSGVSFFSTDSTESTMAEPVEASAPTSEMAFFDEPTASVATETPILLEETAIETPVEAIQENPMVSVMVTEEVIEDTKEPATTASTTDADDIYAPMKRAIAEYEAFLSTLMEKAKKEDDKIEVSNAQIAEAKEIAKRAIDTAKESAKVALEKRKTIDAEMKRIEEMKNVLSLQIK